MQPKDLKTLLKIHRHLNHKAHKFMWLKAAFRGPMLQPATCAKRALSRPPRTALRSNQALQLFSLGMV